MVQPDLRRWADQYSPVHAVAHWDEDKRRQTADYDNALEEAAVQAEKLLGVLGQQIAPKLLEHYPAIVWEDQDECLEVRPEDIAVD